MRKSKQRILKQKWAASDFSAGHAIVVATDAATIEEDARVLQTAELPSQADDLDGDGKLRRTRFPDRPRRTPDAHR